MDSRQKNMLELHKKFSNDRTTIQISVQIFGVFTFLELSDSGAKNSITQPQLKLQISRIGH